METSDIRNASEQLEVHPWQLVSALMAERIDPPAPSTARRWGKHPESAPDAICDLLTLPVLPTRQESEQRWVKDDANAILEMPRWVMVQQMYRARHFEPITREQAQAWRNDPDTAPRWVQRHLRGRALRRDIDRRERSKPAFVLVEGEWFVRITGPVRLGSVVRVRRSNGGYPAVQLDEVRFTQGEESIVAFSNVPNEQEQ